MYFVGRWVSKRGHLGLISRPWEKSRTYFEVVMVVFWAFVITFVFFVSELLVYGVACLPNDRSYCFVASFVSFRR